MDDLLPFLDPLKLLLKTLGISVEHLVEGLKKCVNELGPEASEAVKKLLVTIACGLICLSPLSPNHSVLTSGHVFPFY